MAQANVKWILKEDITITHLQRNRVVCHLDTTLEVIFKKLQGELNVF